MPSKSPFTSIFCHIIALIAKEAWLRWFRGRGHPGRDLNPLKPEAAGRAQIDGVMGRVLGFIEALRHISPAPRVSKLWRY
jgi:hypothetical protein